MECFNRIWPHRWVISLSGDDPRASEKGPVVEGQQRPPLNALKITDTLFAMDYNMQSEYSDRSTFIHEFGHSLSLPDVYSHGQDGNSTGFWEVMSANADTNAQEMSSYNKMSLGWISPKVIKQGENTSAYLGAYNFVDRLQRDKLWDYEGPWERTVQKEGQMVRESIVSETFYGAEPVYRSILVATKPTKEQQTVITLPEDKGDFTAYSGRFDGDLRTLSLKVQVPEAEDEDATLSFDLLYHIETATNFDSKEEEIKVIVDYDIGHVRIDDQVVATMRTLSGDADFDTLVEAHPNCDAKTVLAFRSKHISTGLDEAELAQYKAGRKACSMPIWLNHQVDLSAHRGKTVTVSIDYKTDSGYTELGILADNFKLGDTALQDFETGKEKLAGDFKLLKEGKETLEHNQFYLFEYRTPGEEYKSLGRELSYNMDNNIAAGRQSYFTNTGVTEREKFRMATFDYRPGVLVWYFNSKYNRRQNDPVGQNGQGYLLVLNSKVKELPVPGPFANPAFFDEKGHYKTEDPIMKSFVEDQRKRFTCFSHIDYATYLSGKKPDCSGDYMDFMQTLTFEGKKLRFRRERINEILPMDRFNYFSVGKPLRNSVYTRTGLATFNPAGSKDFRPFTVYKEVNGEMVLDEQATRNARSFAPVSSFSDKDNAFEEVKRFKADSVVVEKKGFRFDVTMPSIDVMKFYSEAEKAESNFNIFRRPRAKLHFRWE